MFVYMILTSFFTWGCAYGTFFITGFLIYHSFLDMGLRPP
jgi:hypothetical protein